MRKIAIHTGLILLIIITSCTKKMQESHEGHEKQNDDMLTLNEHQRLVVNLKTDTAQIRKLFEETTLLGTAAVDERAINVVSARVKGRLDMLFVRNPGTHVKIGDPLYSIYSEELLSYESEYLLAIEQNNLATTQKELTKRMVESARRRLELWTLTERQINELGRNGKISPLITFYSNRSGYLSELLVREGEYVETGTPLFQLADLSSLWIEAQFYSGEINYLSQSPSLEIEFEAFPGERIQGMIVFDNPRLENNTKINLVRVRLDNKQNKYKPGMMAYVFLKRNETRTLVIPKSALLVENNIIVWVETPDGMFKQQMVTIGIQNKREVEILRGLSPGDVVVIRGAFLLNSAWKVKQGGGAMSGMKM